MKRFFNQNKKPTVKTVNITLEDIRRQRSLIERRIRKDRRSAYDLNYFNKNGIERRKGDERRRLLEKRNGWVRAEKWRSVFVGKKNTKRKY
ncbi:MAG: hypothetical protein JRF40_02200 [Deltaproteobacteria bacterium]|nr:hypothetical protein [Deltaproteobacteria bacterium]MBW2218294.1 hypothetical protein [Deltaproteobacteria bacterium]